MKAESRRARNYMLLHCGWLVPVVLLWAYALAILDLASPAMAFALALVGLLVGAGRLLLQIPEGESGLAFLSSTQHAELKLISKACPEIGQMLLNHVASGGIVVERQFREIKRHCQESGT